MVERVEGRIKYFLVVHCLKYDTYHNLPLSSPSDIDPGGSPKIQRDYPCLKHNTESDNVTGKYKRHASESVLVSVRSLPLDQKEKMEFAAIDKGIIIFESMNLKSPPRKKKLI